MPKDEKELPPFVLSEHEDLNIAWAKAVREIERRTSLDLSSGRSSVSGVLEAINHQDTEPSKREKAKTVFKNVLVCVQRFGDVVAQATSVVFGGSQQVFNGISILIKATQQYSDIFANLTKVMERISVFLERLDARIKGPSDMESPLLRRATYRVLGDLVTIIVTWHQMTTSKMKKFKLMMGVIALGSDGGMLEHLHSLETLVADVTSVTVDEIYRGMDKSLTMICDMSQVVNRIDIRVEQTAGLVQEGLTLQKEAAQAAAENDERYTRQLKRINTLAEKGEVSTKNIEAAVTQMRTSQSEKDDEAAIKERLDLRTDDEYLKGQDTRFRDTLKGTGQWLLAGSNDSSELFDSWNKATSESANVLGIQGDEGFGKSYLLYNIAERLREDGKALVNVSSTTRKPSVAHFYPRDDVSRKVNLLQCMKYIVYQLVRQDKEFHRHVAKSCREAEDGKLHDVGEMFDLFFADYAKQRPPPGTTFYILIDYINDEEAVKADIGNLQVLVSRLLRHKPEEAGLQLHFLLCGRPHVLEPLVSRIHIIDLSPNFTADLPQEADLRLLLQRELNSSGILSEDNEEQRDLYAEIMDSLPRKAKGDFITLKTALEDIKASDSVDGMRRAMERSSESTATRIEQDVKLLNAQLDRTKIDQLNEICFWVACSKPYGGATGSLLDAILAAKNMPMMRNKIYDFLKNDCANIFRVKKLPGKEQDFIVHFTRSEVVEFLQQEAKAPRNVVSEPEANMIGSILKNHFKHVFGDNPGLELYNKFDFDGFLSDKLNAQGKFIRVDDDETTAIRSTEECLRTICEWNGNEQLKSLLEYSAEYFDDHFIDCSTELVSDKAAMESISRKLCTVLCDTSVMETYITEPRIWGMTDHLDGTSPFAQKAVDWLGNPDVQQILKSTKVDKQWLKDMATDATNPALALKFVNKFLLKRWLDSDEDVSTATVVWFRGFRKMERTSGTAEDLSSIFRLPADKGEVDDFETAATKTLDNEGNDARWHFRMAGFYITIAEWFDSKVYAAHALSRCNKSLDREPTWWAPKLYQARALRLSERYAKCLSVLEDIEATSLELLAQSTTFEKAYWNHIVPMLGSLYLKSKKLATAVTWFRKLVDHDIENEIETSLEFETAVQQLLGIFNEQKRHQDSIELIRALNESFLGKKSRLQLLLEESISRGVHDDLIQLGYLSSEYELLDRIYEPAVDTTEDRDDQGMAVAIKFNRLKFQWYCGPKEYNERVVHELEQLHASTRVTDEWRVSTVHFYAVKMLVVAILEQARRADFEDIHTKKLLKQLERLEQKSSDGLFEVQLAKARLYRKLESSDEARAILKGTIKELMGDIKQCLDDDEDARPYYLRLAKILPVLDDDKNAQVAWCLMEPNRVGVVDATAEKVDSVTGNDESDKVAEDGEAPVPENTESTVDNAITNEVPVEKRPNSPPTDVPEMDSDDGTTDEMDDTIANAPITDLAGTLFHSCDGCRMMWTYATDLWVCKDCIDVQLCTVCHDKLEADGLNVSVCNKRHSHVSIPVFNADEWRASDPKSVKVGDTIISRRQWLQDLSDEWELGLDMLHASEGDGTSAAVPDE